MKKIIIVLTFLISFSGFAQIQPDWFGHYKGVLKVRNEGGDKYYYHMDLIFNPVNDSAYTWTMIYMTKDSSSQTLDYTLVQRKTQYIIKDKDSSLAANDLLTNQFMSFFEINGNFLQVTYKFENDNIYFSLISNNQSGAAAGKSFYGEEIPVLYSCPLVTFQTATLNKLKE